MESAACPRRPSTSRNDKVVNQIARTTILWSKNMWTRWGISIRLVYFLFDWEFSMLCLQNSWQGWKLLNRLGKTTFLCFNRFYILPTMLLVTSGSSPSLRKWWKGLYLNLKILFAEHDGPTILHSQWGLPTMEGTLDEVCAIPRQVLWRRL